MGMRDSRLGKDPSTALENGSFAIAAKMSEYVCMWSVHVQYARIMFLLRSITQPESGVGGRRILREIKAAGGLTETVTLVCGTFRVEST